MVGTEDEFEDNFQRRIVGEQANTLDRGNSEVSASFEHTGAGVAAVERALSILEAFGDDDASLSLAEISARTGLYKSTILRLIQSLERFSYVARGSDGRYRIGPGAWRLGVIFKRELRIEERLMPLIAELARQTNESVSFWIPIVNPPPPMRVCLLRVESPYAVRYHLRIGDRLPLEPSGARKPGVTSRVIRAFLVPDNPEDDDVRKTGVCTSWGERDPEIAGISAAVFDGDNRLVGSLTVSAPTSRHDRGWIESTKPIVMAMADRATRALGGHSGLPRG